jgi:hypothetical protein
MQFAHPNSQQIITVLGGEYVAERHGDAALWNLASRDVDEVIKSLTASMFGEVMKSLRGALSLR